MLTTESAPGSTDDRSFRVRALASILCLVLVVPATGSSKEPRRFSEKTEILATIIDELFSPEKSLLDVKLAVDAMVDPSSQPGESKSVIDRMANEITAMTGTNADEMVTLATLRKYLYQAGPWNSFSPFEYDPKDPLGENPESRRLESYLRTRKGNCITMPSLMLALGQRLGLDMTLAEAPLHTFIKFTDRSGKTWNLEATSGGGFTRDEWYRKNLKMSDRAISNGVYLRALTRDESVALIASFLVEDRMTEKDFEGAITIAEVLLRHYPDFAYVMVKMGSAYTGLIRQGLIRYQNGLQHSALETIDQWNDRSMEAFKRAELLGWSEDDGLVDP